MADILGGGIEATVPTGVREVVTAVKALKPNDTEGVSVTRVAKHMGFDKGTVSRRVKDAVRRGLLVNLPTKRGVAARIVLGDALPEEVEILPAPSALADQCCSVAPQEE